MSPTDVKIAAHALKKFSGTNFLLWQCKMKLLLTAKKLWPYVDLDASLGGSGIEDSMTETVNLLGSNLIESLGDPSMLMGK
jgi:hypothetical protein